ALSQGMTAGLSAYRHVYHKKFGAEPPLFAYRPTDFVLYPDFQELPPLNHGLKPKALVPEKALGPVMGKDWSWLVDRLDGRSSVDSLAAEGKVSPEALEEKLTQLVEKKMITFHIEIDG
ncbi:MAG: hypothetical protein GY849_04070, partial [Deltaproteobacteria bacterium]|nr:hypothetical protein [Deltaproteobacteria bacterium]